MAGAPSFAEKRRLLQLETLYDLALALHAERDEEDLLEELLGRVCLVLDPSAAVAVTRDPVAGARALALVGWPGPEPTGGDLLAESIWRELLSEGQPLVRRAGTLAGAVYGELVAAPLAFRNVFLGYVALLDKEERGGGPSGFTAEDRRFLESVGNLAGVALDSARRVESLETQRERLAEENRALRGDFQARVGGQRIIAVAPAMRKALDLVERVAPRSVSVLVRGESGTGKELIAKLLHHLSGREGPLVAINCGAMPESLLESELFGIEGGVATGVQARRGKFELADGGTLFLDELGDMPPVLQVKLLRALQEREVVRVGGEEPIPVDVRVVAATHRHLERLVAEGRFREDLYYRLKGIELELPALRERREDVPHLVRFFVEDFCRREQVAPPMFTKEALALLLEHDYPGNVRELQNLVEGAVSLADGRVDVELLRSLLGGASEGAGPEPLDLAGVEKRHIAKVLQMVRGNKSEAARILGVDRKTLQRKGY
ncbi:MAG: sigma 54-interacting transcriptional regulator [Acidobacteria bacterium]|nr:sigma 54-interacting transcriptional regulator [Acidobacteriota bacterium]MCB9377832.1 sigma 54-interacting transcriptional regulator [Holophagales bacterium]